MAAAAYYEPVAETVVYEKGKYQIIERNGLYRVAFVSGKYRHDWSREYKRLGNAKRYLRSILDDAYGHGRWSFLF